MAITRDVWGRDRVKPVGHRLWLCGVLTVVAFVALAWRLYALQILRGDELAHRGQRNFLQRVEIPHDRGMIYDRHGRILADNRPTLDAHVTPAFLGRGEERLKNLKRLAELLNLPEEEHQRIIEEVQSRRSLEMFRSFVVRRDMDRKEVAALEGERGIFRLDGVEVKEGRRRTYPFGRAAAHVLGYVNEIDPKTLRKARENDNPLHYQRGDIIGRDGLERSFEDRLRGRDGYRQIIVDAKGRQQADSPLRDLMRAHPHVKSSPGHNLVLTLDIELQQRIEAAFQSRGGRAGSVVAMDPRDGSILALASIPSFNPTIVSGDLAADSKHALDSDPLKPWINRAIHGLYPPGSTFKPVTALAALRQNAIPLREEVYCPGHFRLGRHTWRCHRDAGHGPVDLKQSLKVSCDVYYYTAAQRIGIDNIAEMARLLGLGQPTGIDLRGEKSGLVPDEAFHDRVDRRSGGYQGGMAINTSIGQGALLTTPLQVARLYAALINGGQVLVPRLVDRIETADFRVIQRSIAQQSTPLANRDALDNPGFIHEAIKGEPPVVLETLGKEVVRTVSMPERGASKILAGLEAVVQEPGGTAYWRRSRRIKLGGKTGTAQVVRLDRKRLAAEDMEYLARDHAWFVGYAPIEDPEIVVAVLNEHAGHGGSKAAPIAVDAIEAYFDIKSRRAQEAASHLLKDEP